MNLHDIRHHSLSRAGAATVLLIALAACGSGHDSSRPALVASPPVTVAPAVDEAAAPTTTTAPPTTVPETTTTTVTASASPTTTRVAAPIRRTTATTTAVVEEAAPEPPVTTTPTVPPLPPTVAPPPPQPPVASHGGPVRDHVSLVDNLRTRGLTVTPTGSVFHPFLEGEGTVLAVAGAGIAPTNIQSVEYESAQAAAADAATFGPDGNPRGASVGWMGPPHLYLKGRVIVIYVGSDPHVTDLLTDLLGPQFSGR